MLISEKFAFQYLKWIFIPAFVEKDKSRKSLYSFKTDADDFDPKCKFFLK